MIDDFAFGTMVIQGRTYTSDLFIYPDGHIVDGWWRQRGHRLTIGDVTDLLKVEMDTLIVGMGVHGMMKPASGVESSLKARGVRLLAAKNEQAVEWFNQRFSRGGVGGCFHLSC